MLDKHSLSGEQDPLYRVPALLEKLCGVQICRTSYFLVKGENLFHSRARASQSPPTIALLCDLIRLVELYSAGIRERVVNHKGTLFWIRMARPSI